MRAIKIPENFSTTCEVGSGSFFYLRIFSTLSLSTTLTLLITVSFNISYNSFFILLFHYELLSLSFLSKFYFPRPECIRQCWSKCRLFLFLSALIFFYFILIQLDFQHSYQVQLFSVQFPFLLDIYCISAFPVRVFSSTITYYYLFEHFCYC